MKIWGKAMLRKGLAVCIILLFIGLALTPTTYADVSKPVLDTVVRENINEEDCGCEDETTEWGFPVTCIILYTILLLSIRFVPQSLLFTLIYDTCAFLMIDLHCFGFP